MNRIVMIEDDLIISRVYRHKLQMAGFDVVLATDGESGLVAVASANPDIVLLDLMLPKLSGLSVLQKIRTELNMPLLPVIVFSNAHMTDMLKDAWRTGATCVVSKSDHLPQQVVTLVQQTLAQHPRAAPPSMQGAASPSEQDPAPAMDPQEEAKLLESYLASTPQILKDLQPLLDQYIQNPDNPSFLSDLHRRIHAITSNFGASGIQRVSTLAAALEALIQELQDNPEYSTPSSLRTVAQGVDALLSLCEYWNHPTNSKPLQAYILVVDDDTLSLHAINDSLARANLKALCLDNAQAAIESMERNRFDLAILDIMMPDMDGFALGAKMRETPVHARTPIIFITSAGHYNPSEFPAGSDLITKPFLPIELAVKALALILKMRSEKLHS